MNRTGNRRTGNSILNVPVKAGVTLAECTIVALDADGYAIPAAKQEGLRAAGCAQKFTDNSGGADGSVTAYIDRGTYVWKNDGTIKATDILKPCYIKDEVTVTLTAEGSSPAGIIMEAETDYVTVDMTHVIQLETE